MTVLIFIGLWMRVNGLIWKENRPGGVMGD
jgi:hypothetical protein